MVIDRSGVFINRMAEVISEASFIHERNELPYRTKGLSKEMMHKLVLAISAIENREP